MTTPGDQNSVGGLVTVMTRFWSAGWVLSKAGYLVKLGLAGLLSKAPLGWEQGHAGSAPGFQLPVLHQGSICYLAVLFLTGIGVTGFLSLAGVPER